MIPYYKRTFIKLFSLLQELNADPYGKSEICHIIQDILVIKTRYVEKKIRAVKKNIETSSTLDELDPLNDLLQGYRNVLMLLKFVGDGIAHVYIDRWDIKPFSFNGSPGFISGKKGFLLEQRMRIQTAKLGVPSLLADLTNCLTHGDLYCFYPEMPPQIIEVKSGKIGSKDRKQLRKLGEVLKYLATDKTENAFGTGYTVWRKGLHSPVRDHIKEFNKQLGEASVDGESYLKVEDGLLYAVAREIDLDKLKDLTKNFNSPILYYLNSTKYESQGFYPYVISWRKPEALFDFYVGDLLFVVVVDRSILVSTMLSYGFDAEFIEDDEHWCLRVTDNKDNGNWLKISAHFFHRIAHDFISMEWLCQELVYRFEEFDSLN